jgi:hypothetical protein
MRFGADVSRRGWGYHIIVHRNIFIAMHQKGCYIEFMALAHMPPWAALKAASPEISASRFTEGDDSL